MCAQSTFLLSSTKQENRSNGIFQESLYFNFRCVLIHFLNWNISALSIERWFMLINHISISTVRIQQKNQLTFLQCSEVSKQQGLCNDFVWDDGGMHAIFIILGFNILITFFIFVFFIAILSSKNPCTLNGNTTCYSIFNFLFQFNYRSWKTFSIRTDKLILRYIQYDHIFSEMSTTNFEISATSRYDNFICFSVY